MYAFAASHTNPQPHLALVHESTDLSAPVLVRMHSECITGDLFGSLRCDCGAQFNAAMDLISQQGGIMLYLRQEGRGIGLISKMEAYRLQDQGLDTVQANMHLGFQPDERDFTLAVTMLQTLQVHAIQLLTNNPEKIAAIENSPIVLAGRVPLVIPAGADNASYLKTKQEMLGHLL